MRFGACVDYTYLPLLEEEGYDYLEYNLGKLATMSEEEYAQICEAVEKSPLKIESTNGFFASGISVTGPDVDMEQIRRYTEVAMERVAKLGGKVTVLGSGAARNIPEGFDFNTAYEQFAQVLGICGEIAAKYGIVIAVEPLQKKETNLINTVEEGMEICKKVNHPNVKCLADFYHVYRSGETLDAIRTGGDMLAHVHIARAKEDRYIPFEEDIPDCKVWAEALKECGYDARISLEGGYVPDIPAALKRGRKILEVFK